MGDAGTGYLYRGTILAWPGSEATQVLGTTCTSTDPYVAVHFAVECRNKGEAVLLAIRRGKVREVGANHFAVFESAVNLDVAPTDFFSIADRRVDVDRALQYLETLGFADVPVRIRGASALHDILKQSFAARRRLKTEQIDHFNALIFAREP